VEINPRIVVAIIQWLDNPTLVATTSCIYANKVNTPVKIISEIGEGFLSAYSRRVNRHFPVLRACCCAPVSSTGQALKTNKNPAQYGWVIYLRVT
jgi:hypothetical protein